MAGEDNVKLGIGAVAAALCIVAGTATAQQTFTIKFASFVGEGASTSRMFKAYVEEWKQKSNGRLNVEIYWGSSMGPLPRHYDLARTGVADMSFYQHGATPGRFPLTELTHMPYLFPNGFKGALVGAKVAADLFDEFLAREHAETKNMYIVYNRPSGIYDAKKPIKALSDLRGRRYRAPTTTDVALFTQLGAVPIGVPATAMAESLQKGTIDGVVTDPMGIFAFKMGDLVKYYTPMFVSAISFGIDFNLDTYKKLPADLRAIIDGSSGKEGAIRMATLSWEDFPEFTKYMTDSKIETVALSQKDDAEMRKIADKVIEERVAQVEAKGLPGRALYTKAKQLSDKYSKE
jgi:TRAP-type C4-dicarboxylate transport system substrate-binding protein